MKSWWNCVAKEVKRQPKAATRPPMTAVSRVDFLRQNDIVTGDTRRPTDMETAPTHPETDNMDVR